MMHGSGKTPARSLPNAPYEILILGELDVRWVEWFQGIELSSEDHDAGPHCTRLRCPVIDQANLRGILNKIWDMNLDVISVSRVSARAQECEPSQVTAAHG